MQVEQREAQVEKREEIKKMIEEEGLLCDCGERVYKTGTGSIEKQPNYNRFFDYLECPRCRKEYDL